MNTAPTLSAHRWHILGAGAIGGLWACQLVSTGHPVSIVCHSDRQYAGFNACPQLTLGEAVDETLYETGDETLDKTLNKTIDQTQGTAWQHYPVTPEFSSDALPISQLLITTKSHQTEQAIAPLAHRIKADTTVVIMQNGMGSQQWLAQRFPDCAVYAGTTTEGAYRTAPQHIIHAGRGDSYFGPLTARAQLEQQDNAAITDLLQLPLSGHYDSDIEQRLWQKLAINCVINPLTAIHNCRNGVLIKNRQYQQQMRQLCQEFEQVSNALGRPLFSQPLYQVAQQVAADTAENISSMLQDIRRQRPSEIDYINGYLCRLAAELGLQDSVATHYQLLHQVHRLEQHS